MQDPAARPTILVPSVSYVDALFTHFDVTSDGGLNKNELAEMVVRCNPSVVLADEQVIAIVEEVFRQYKGSVEPGVGLSKEGLHCIYRSGRCSAQQDCAACGLLPQQQARQPQTTPASADSTRLPDSATSPGLALAALDLGAELDRGQVDGESGLSSRFTVEVVERILSASAAEDPFCLKEVQQQLQEMSDRDAYSAWMALGAQLTARRCHKQAVECYEHACTRCQDPRGFFRKGSALVALHRFAEARAAFTTALQLVQPTSDLALLPKIRVNLGIALEAAGLLLGASEQYREATLICPQHYRAFKLLGSAHFALGDLAGARVALEHSLQLKPDYADAFSDLGCTLCNLGDIQGAKQAFRQAVAINSAHLEALYNLGNLHRQCLEYEQACACYEAVLKVEPGHWRTLLNKAVVFLLLGGRQSEAQEALKAAQKLCGFALGVDIKQLSQLCGENNDDIKQLNQLLAQLCEHRQPLPAATTQKRIQGWRARLTKSQSTQDSKAGTTLRELRPLHSVAAASIIEEFKAMHPQAERDGVKLGSRVDLELALRRVLSVLPSSAFQELMRIVYNKLLPLLDAPPQGSLVDTGMVLCLLIPLCKEPFEARLQACYEVLSMRSGRATCGAGAQFCTLLKAWYLSIPADTQAPASRKPTTDQALSLKEFQRMVLTACPAVQSWTGQN